MSLYCEERLLPEEACDPPAFHPAHRDASSSTGTGGTPPSAASGSGGVAEVDSLNLDGGVRSFADPNLLSDERVLTNVLRRGGGEGVDTTTTRANYFKTVQTEIKPHMRRIVADWMLEVTEEHRCQPGVFSLAVDYLDRILSQVNISKSQFQLLAAVCILLASKFKESSPLCTDKLVVYTDFSVKAAEITSWELLALQVLDWDLAAVTPFCVLDLVLRRLDLAPLFDPVVVRRHAETLVSLAATEYPLSAAAPGALLALAALLAACNGLARTQEQSAAVRRLLRVLAELGGRGEAEVLDCVARIEEVLRERMPDQQQHVGETGQQQQHQQEDEPMQTTTTMTRVAAAATAKLSPVAVVGGPAGAPSASPTDVMDFAVSCV